MTRLASMAFGVIAYATTLEKLSLDDMVAKSTEIVRGKVVGSSAAQRGGILYTQVTVQVIEWLKGASAPTVEVTVPGGTLNGFRQSFSGAPKMSIGTEYVFFLWRGRSGLAQIIGLSQGLMDVKLDGQGKAVVTRSASAETVIDRVTGHVVVDAGFTMSLTELRDYVKRRTAEAH